MDDYILIACLIIFEVALLIFNEWMNIKRTKDKIYKLKSNNKLWIVRISLPLLIFLVPALLNYSRRQWFIRVMTGSKRTVPDYLSRFQMDSNMSLSLWIIMVTIGVIYIVAISLRHHGVFSQQGFYYMYFIKYSSVDYFKVDSKYHYIEIYRKNLFNFKHQLNLKTDSDEMMTIINILEDHDVIRKTQET